MFTLHGEARCRTFWAASALVYRRDADASAEILVYINDLGPTDFMRDYDLVIRSAVQRVLPAARLHGCYFRFSQAVRWHAFLHQDPLKARQ